MFMRLAMAGCIALAIVPTRALVEPGTRMAAESNRPFCERNPHTCGAIPELWTGLRTKVVLAGTSAYKIVLQEIERGERPMPGQSPNEFPPHAADLKGTLNARDRMPDWDAKPDGGRG
ncbi:MAG: hypothetical protein AAFV26_11380 [Pseudomonadota bacterium]